MSSFLKKNVPILLVWLGQRLLDNSDLQEFNPPISHCPMYFTELQATSWAMTRGSYKQRLKRSKSYSEPYAENMRKEARNDFLKRKKIDLRHQREIYWIGNQVIQDILSLKKQSLKMAIILILSPLIAEAKWYPDFARKIKRAAAGQFYYEIIYGTYLNTTRIRREQEKSPNKSSYADWELRAAELGMAGIYFDSDAPSNGAMRLSNFVGRVAGADLKGENFPEYSISDLQRMAWHINRENFNWGSPRTGAIPKYEIGSDYRPNFTVEPVSMSVVKPT